MSTVLVIDDSRAVRAYVRELLPEEHEVMEASDGAAGLEVIRKTPPDLVLLDIEMPGMNGLDLLGRLEPERLYTVILFTTRSSIDSIVAGLEAGADDYIVKPFQPEEFRARVAAGLRTALRRRELDRARRTAEEALLRLQQTEKLCLARERMMAIASLASGAAHQINNPLGFIMSNMSVLDRYSRTLVDTLAEISHRYPEGGTEEILAKRNISRITADIPELITESFQGLRRIARIVRGLSLLQPAMDFIDRTKVDMDVLIDALIELQKPSLPEGVGIIRRTEAFGLMVETALPLMNTVFETLLANAVEAVVEGTIEVVTARRGGWAVITISNPAPSLEEVDPKRFLEPFYSTKSPEEHAGLGLSVAERFVISQGGSLDVSLTPEGCFMVEVRLPLAEADCGMEGTPP